MPKFAVFILSFMRRRFLAFSLYTSVVVKSLLSSTLLDRTHMAIFTELYILYSRYRPTRVSRIQIDIKDHERGKDVGQSVCGCGRICGASG